MAVKSANHPSRAHQLQDWREAFKNLPPVVRDAVIRFADRAGLSDTAPDAIFEYFATFHVLRSAGLEDFDFASAVVAGTDDTQLDTVAITVNGALVTTEEEVERLVQEAIDGAPFAVRFLFAQATMGTKFPSDKVALFASGVQNFFLPHSRLAQSNPLVQARTLKDRVLAGLASLGDTPLPFCDVYVVWPGTWTREGHSEHATGVAEAALATLEATGLLARATFHRVDSTRLQSLIVDELVANATTLELSAFVELPAVPGVSFGCIGTVRAIDYLGSITRESQTGGERQLMDEAFHGNVRAFLGPEERINRRIQSTLLEKSGAEQGEFVLRNNGVTIIAEEARREPGSQRLRLRNFQIVNGCQTSHVLFHNRNDVGPNVHLPIKVVATKDADIAQNVILGLNRQTPIDEIQIVARNEFVRRLKQHFDLSLAPRHKWIGNRRTPLVLFERRAGEYRHIRGDDRMRVVSLLDLMQAYSSAFLEVPHTVHDGHREYFLRQVPKRLFASDHDVGFYYISALLLLRARQHLGSYSAWGGYPAKHQLVLAMRRLADPRDGCPEGRRDGEAHDYLRQMRQLLSDDTQAAALAAEAATVVIAAATELSPPLTVDASGRSPPIRLTAEIARREAMTEHVRAHCLAARERH